jgi:hypothetical protein
MGSIPQRPQVVSSGAHSISIVVVMVSFFPRRASLAAEMNLHAEPGVIALGRVRGLAASNAVIAMNEVRFMPKARAPQTAWKHDLIFVRGGASFRVKRGVAEEMKRVQDQKHVYARALPPAFDGELAAADEKVNAALALLKQAQAERQETLLHAIRRAKPVRVEEIEASKGVPQ